MTALTAALAIGVGIHLALALFLSLRYLEGREPQIGWWAIAYAFFTAQLVTETLITMTPADALFAVRHALFLAASWALVSSFQPRPGINALAVLAIVLSIWLTLASWLTGTLTASVTGAAALVGSAVLLSRREAGLHTTSVRLLFWGLLLGGIHSLDYPLLRLQPMPAAIGAALSGLFTIVFATGAVLWVLERSRDLGTMSAIAEALNRSLDTRDVLAQALRQILGLIRAHRGWIFLSDNGEFSVAAAEHLPSELAAEEMVAMRGDCRCLQMLREGQLTQAVNMVDCMRLERAGWDHPRHATVPLATAGDAIGVMNLVMPRRRTLSPRELATLSALGHQIGLAAERARLYDEVKNKEAMRGELLEKLITAYEDERRRIARGLHDEAGQALTALIVNLELAEQAHKPVDSQNLARLRGIAEHTLAEVRRIIAALRPTILDDLGLAAAIRWYAKELVEPQGLQVSMQLSGLGGRLPPHVETAVFRIVQEAITNVLKHAGARQAWVETSVADGRVRVTVADDGRGFEVTSVPRSREGRRLGLLGMRERAEALGGTLGVSSQPGHGTRIEIVIPVDHHDGSD
ncbi:MAG TPA: GAF domain-containing sensor histidine kinase [bacterium]|nr:GAF domain-containing sensor histidine kinase [bacterium]